MFLRSIVRPLLAALADTPVVLLHGGRQVGKTTLMRRVAEHEHPSRFLTLDDPAVRSAAQADPHGFIDGLDGPAIIDEVQRVPELALAIKAAVDRDRRPGRFLLTGSANVLTVPRLSESLAGRMEILTLWPLSQGEIAAVEEGFIDALFAPQLPRIESVRPMRPALIDRLVRGGYPEAHQRAAEERRRAWFASYVDALLQRDVRDYANIEGLTLMPRLLALLATRIGGLLNYSDLARSLETPQSTLKRYFALLETVFLIHTLPPWSSNLGLRLVKSPKLYLSDTGLATYLLDIDRRRLASDPMLVGRLLENLVVTELRKQSGWSRIRPRLFHYRTQSGSEVDVVIEGPAGKLVGIEIKASSTVRPDDLKGLRQLSDTVGKRFFRGVLLYAGREAVAFGRGLHALPIPLLWQTAAPRR